jgi:hypothetical protein
MLYCDLSYTGKTFKSKKIYKCEKCGLEAGLDSPDANILCFAKTNETHISTMQEANELINQAEENDKVANAIKKLPNRTSIQGQEYNIFEDQDIDAVDSNTVNTSPEYLDLDEHGQPRVAINSASEEQINERMDICNSCEYYKNEACMLCGCRVVRNSVYQNKLADKSASCPDGRWGPIKD